MPEEWKELIVLPIYQKGNKTDYSNYRGISLLPTTYKILSNFMLPSLTPYAEEILLSCNFSSVSKCPSSTLLCQHWPPL